MEARRGGRPPQVRPRPTTPGPARVRIRPATPSSSRLSRHRTIERRRGLPLAAKLALGGSVAVLAWVCLLVGLNLVGPTVSAFAGGLGGMVGSLTHLAATPSPSPSGVISDAPSIEPPDRPVTNAPSVDLSVRMPPAIVGLEGYSCRLWVALANAQPTVVTVTRVGGTSTLVFPAVTLSKGANTFTATIIGPAGESAPSAAVVVTQDASKPKITIAAPANGSATPGATVTVKGKTLAGSQVRVQNDANGATASVAADTGGVFSTKLAVAPGANNITVTVTSPAGNSNTATTTVTRGTGQLRVTLTSTVYQFDSKRLPVKATFSAAVVGADGKAVEGASALFTVTVPGLQPLVSSEMTTDKGGGASFSATIPSGAMAGSGLATVLITLPTGTQTTTAKAVLTVR